MAASRAFSSCTMRREIFLPRASIAMGRAPRTPRTPPSSDNSPTNRQSGTSFLLRPRRHPGFRAPSANRSRSLPCGCRPELKSGSHTVAAFPNRRVRQTYGVEMIFISLDTGDIDLDFDDVGIDAVDCGA